MKNRQLSPVDRFISGLDSALRTVSPAPQQARRPNPAGDIAEGSMSQAEKAHAAGLMRVNHAGEVAAQALYQGHAAVARDPNIKRQLAEAALDERDHLAWCEERLRELHSAPSALGPVWYAGAFTFGAMSGLFGDKWSLGFVEETERQVSDHLGGHLTRLPDNDARSRAIVVQMRAEEELHGANANEAGAARLPLPVAAVMKKIARVMTGVAYRV